MRTPKRWNRPTVDDTDALIGVLKPTGLTNPNMVHSGLTLGDYEEQVADALTAAGVRATPDGVATVGNTSGVPFLIDLLAQMQQPRPECGRPVRTYEQETTDGRYGA